MNNAAAGLFGIGEITSAYIFDRHRHDSGTDILDHLYSHLRKVERKVTSYLPRRGILRRGEKGWPLFGTVGPLLDQIPECITRILHGEGAVSVSPEVESPEVEVFAPPADLAPILEAISALPTIRIISNVGTNP